MPKPSSHSKYSDQIELLKKELRVQRATVSHLKTENYALQQKISPVHHHQEVETIRAILFSIDLSYRFTFASPNTERYTGLKPKHIMGLSLMDFIHPDDAQPFKDQCLQATNKSPQGAMLRFGSPEKDYRWARASVAPLLNRSTCTGFQGVLLETNKDKLAQDLPAADRNKYRDIIDNLREGFFEADLTGRITFCNRAILTLSGYHYDELIGKNYQKIASPRTVRTMKVILGHMYQNRQKIKVFNHKLCDKSGHTLNIEFSVTLMINALGKPLGFQGILRDISEQVNASKKQELLQAQLNHSRKMNALGTLAGGLAHGFNNILMAIQGNLSLIRMRIPQDHPIRKNMDRISQSTEKGGHLTREILSFAKTGKFVVMPTNLNKIIKRTHRMFARSHPNLKIHECLFDNLWQTRVDRVQIGQALLNLYLNAVDSMPKGGDLHLKSENTTLDESDTQPFEAQPGRYVKISVTDSGVGLEDEAKERIFEPFFSAYGPSRYDGLGLATAYGTIKSHQGIINVYSKKGEGTTFTLYLPAEPARTPSKPAVGKTNGVETILVVDDDEFYTRTCREILEYLGYRVMIANSGNAAIELYAKYKDQINLVLLDVILPDIGGDLIFQELRRCNPNATVVVISGYKVDQQISALLSQGCVDFIQKPFPREILANKVRAALDRTAVPPAIAQLIS